MSAISIDYDQPPTPPWMWGVLVFVFLSVAWMCFGRGM
jgi:hypothetical protein